MDWKSLFLKKRNCAIVATALALVLLACLMYCAGKNHYVYADNSDITINGKLIKALDGAVITFDGGEELETFAGMRDEFDDARRQKHHLRVDCNGETVERTFNIPVAENAVIIRIPAFFRYPDDKSLWLESFRQIIDAPEDISSGSGASSDITQDGEFVM
ncbi:MAG TPA: hypothetical protein DCO86_01835 [Spirochaetaceae bacterium]|nr:hypothetical protein [Spirochaetaceae bacterium]